MSKQSQKTPYIIGVAGGSGSGKTTVVKNLLKALPKKSVVTISHDDYYLDQTEKPMAEREATNYDHPDSLETELLIKHLKMLRNGEKVEKPTYDFAHHTRAAETEVLKPAKVIIVEGILVLEALELRRLLDLKIFVQTDDDIRIIRRITRDMKERGRTFQFVVDQYLKFTRPMYLRFVEPTKRHADIVIPEGGENEAALAMLGALVKEKLS